MLLLLALACAHKPVVTGLAAPDALSAVRAAALEGAILPEDMPFGALLEASGAFAYVDGPGGRPVMDLLRSLDCEASWSESEGYGAVALPPPMVDDADEDVPLIEAAIARLQEGREVMALCTKTHRWDECEGIEGCYSSEEVVEEPQYVVNVTLRDGGWFARAWLDLR